MNYIFRQLSNIQTLEFTFKLTRTDFIQFCIQTFIAYSLHSIFQTIHFINNILNISHLNLHFNSYCLAFVLHFSAPLKPYSNGRTYSVRRQQDRSDSANAQLYDDHPTRPCSQLGPFYRRCPVCQKSIPAHDIIPLISFIISRTTPAPLAWIFSSPVVSKSVSSVIIPICTFD